MGKDPYRYFRIEAQELLEGLSEGLLALDRDSAGAPDPELLRRLLRQAHTLKGASRVVKRRDIADIAHRLEDLLESLADAPREAARRAVDGALSLLDEIRSEVATLAAAPGEQPGDTSAPAPPALDDDAQSVRVPVRDLDVLIESAHEARIAAAELRDVGGELAPIRDGAAALLAVSAGAPRRVRRGLETLARQLDTVSQSLTGALSQVLAEVDELGSLGSDLRLVPASGLTTDLQRVVRDAARTAGKDAELRVVGSDTRLDAHVLAGLRRALVHVVRNSVAHGIESPEERARAGKPATGRIDLSIRQRGHRVVLLCRDDGRGMDLAAVRRAAVERGLVTAEVARELGASALGRLLLGGGLSTSRAVTGLAGRGVGLEAVRHAVEDLKGEVLLRSEGDAGVEVEIRVPLSLASVPALAVSAGSTQALVPLDSVRRALRVAPEDVSRDGDRQHLVVDRQVLPYLPLRRALGEPEVASVSAATSAVVLEAEGRFAAIGVDRLGATRSVVVHPLPSHADIDPIVSGASLDDRGVPQIVLAPQALLHSAHQGLPARVVEEATTLPLLVIDDSLTTRMLEQSILESAGYEVDLATSGEEGLARARARRYGAFVVDVEMPGISGFEFIAQTRADPALRDIPSILVTSRAEPGDKRRGKEVGARAYIVKSEFDQDELLKAIRRLVG